MHTIFYREHNQYFKWIKRGLHNNLRCHCDVFKMTSVWCHFKK